MYFPKSQITTNLYTNGEEYMYASSKQKYTGYYWKTSSGKIYTGKNPQDIPTQQLLPIEVPYTEPSNNGTPFVESYLNLLIYGPSFNEEQQLIKYTSLKNIDTNVKILAPFYSPVSPTQQDYQIGEMRRYFCKKTNENMYLEINKDFHDKLAAQDPTVAFQYYTPFNIPWKIAGDKTQAFTTNKNIVELTMKRKKLPMFDKYLKEDYLKYYQ